VGLETLENAPDANSVPKIFMSMSNRGLSENGAALLSYVLGWLTGLIVFLIDKRSYVRFHAAQSIVVFGGLHVIQVVIAATFGLGWRFGRVGTSLHLGAGLILLDTLSLFSLVLWIVCIVKAYQGVRFKVPVAGEVAEKLATGMR
jgi:uncharacterized membrane protein